MARRVRRVAPKQAASRESADPHPGLAGIAVQPLPCRRPRPPFPMSLPNAEPRPTSLLRLLGVERDEAAALAWSFLYFFSLLTGYYVLRPVRDAMGATGQLQWLFTGTFIAMLLVTPLYGALVSRFPRRVFLPVVYAFFLACLLLFHVAFLHEEPWIAPAFFIWVAVFNLFAVSVFWSFMADNLRHGQAKRLYGAIGAAAPRARSSGPPSPRRSSAGSACRTCC